MSGAVVSRPWVSTHRRVLPLGPFPSRGGRVMQPALLKIPDVVARLGVSRAKVYELMASGELRTVRIGGSRRVHVDDLTRFIARLDDSAPAGAYAHRPPIARVQRR